MKDLINQALNRLPQIGVLDPADVQRWVHDAYQRDPSRLLWHINRQSAIGGSEIGTLLLEQMGRTGPFNTGAGIMNEKLFKRLISPGNRYMKRGTVLENVVKQVLLNLYGGTIDVAAQMAMLLPHPSDAEGMAGNTDLIWLAPDQKRIIFDIKIPFESTDQADLLVTENDKFFQYSAQGHHYDILSSTRGFPADRIAIAELDIDPELAFTMVHAIEKGGSEAEAKIIDQITMLAKFGRPGCRLNLLEVDMDLRVDLGGRKVHIKEAIPETSAMTMQAVCAGMVPDMKGSGALPLSEAETLQLSQLESTLTEYRALAEHLDSAQETTKAEITQLLQFKDLDGAKFRGGVHDIGITTKFDIDSAMNTLSRYPVSFDELKADPPDQPKISDYDIKKMLAMLEENGIDPKACLKDGKYETAKVKEALEQVGEDPQRFVSQSAGVTKSRRKDAVTQFGQSVDLSDGFLTQYPNYLQERIQTKNQIDLEHSEDSAPEMSIA